MTGRALVTGANGFLGRAVVDALVRRGVDVVGVDLAVPDAAAPGVTHVVGDVRDADGIDALFAEHRPDVVVHLASIVTPGRGTTPEQEYAVDVDGARTVLEACAAHGTRRIVVSSSGAAYGYHEDNPDPITECAEVRGNDEFTYSKHKRLVEEMLAEYRNHSPQLEQVVFRIGTILGERVDNQITALFDKPRLLVVKGSASPFVFVWDTDVAEVFALAVTGDRVGVFNVAGDGTMTVPEIAAAMGKSTLTLPAWVLAAALRIGRALGVTEHGPERVGFLQYRPVLSNQRLKDVFGYTPRYTTREAFDAYLAARTQRADPAKAGSARND
ncbi:NAD-dependent epimerase/dehydratase family protein [Rhodococcus sp. HNM0569]|uniref:NAD-dependent epimerase/dehydratase family protein n=1 Tax=Rhodococcus sp. HNM0569 TaxID=2716340 RepID=UPI00146ED4A5|nr:NAD-dependent epimerase/dehydratase family protein [Rhodococcus sp. HNM0569]NLU83064.1 NAD-dependent epimerase/dehydratase family protein [Rhodococcus sp. HNM0569]